MMAQHAPRPRPAPSSNAPACCGLWSGPRRSAAVLFDPLTQRQLTLSLANTAPAHTTLLDWLAEQSAHLVIPDTLLALPCLNQASQTPVAVWVAPSALLEAIRLAAGLTTRAPKYTAALLARWPSAPALRPFLRRLAASPHPHQIALL
jgi:hypothetical protein